MGIGGEYAAINSAIDELIPARYRGRVDIAINGTYWAGAILGTIGTFIFLKVIDLSLGWRLAFLIGPVLGLVILLVRRNLPESPRWQVMNGRVEAAEQLDHLHRAGGGVHWRDAACGRRQQGYRAATHREDRIPGAERVLFRDSRRSVLGAMLMISQSFLYNAIFFTYTLVLGKFYGVASESTPLYLIAFAIGNLAGAVDDWALLRHHRPQEDDRSHVPAVRCCWRVSAVCQHWGAQRVSRRSSPGASTSFRVGRGQRCLPHRERDLSVGGPGEGDCGVLRHRAMLRRAWPRHLRRTHRRWLIVFPVVPGLLARRGSDGGRWIGRLVPRGRCRRQIAGRRRESIGSRRRPAPDGFESCGGGDPQVRLARSPGRLIPSS